MPPAARALIVELLAVVAVAGLARLVALPVGAWAVVAGLLGAAGARVWRMDRWWPWLLGAFPIAVWAALALDLPAWSWAVAAAGVLLAYGGVYRTQVPLFLSRRPVWEAVLAVLPPPQPGRRIHFVDLGSGLGGLPRFIGRQRPDVDARGVELAPLPVAIAWLRQRVAPAPNVRLSRADLWREPLQQVDVAFAFLSPVPMPALWRKLSAELSPGALFISCEFPVPGVEPVATRDAAGRRLHLYRVGPKTD